jgi:hypothetical protein
VLEKGPSRRRKVTIKTPIGETGQVFILDTYHEERSRGQHSAQQRSSGIEEKGFMADGHEEPD